MAVWFVVRGVLLGGEGLKLGSGLQISKLALGWGLGLRALVGPILKLERPTPVCCSVGWPSSPTWTIWPTNPNAYKIGVW